MPKQDGSFGQDISFLVDGAESMKKLIDAGGKVCLEDFPHDFMQLLEAFSSFYDEDLPARFGWSKGPLTLESLDAFIEWARSGSSSVMSYRKNVDQELKAYCAIGSTLGEQDCSESQTRKKFLKKAGDGQVLFERFRGFKSCLEYLEKNWQTVLGVSSAVVQQLRDFYKVGKQAYERASFLHPVGNSDYVDVLVSYDLGSRINVFKGPREALLMFSGCNFRLSKGSVEKTLLAGSLHLYQDFLALYLEKGHLDGEAATGWLRDACEYHRYDEINFPGYRRPRPIGSEKEACGSCKKARGLVGVRQAINEPMQHMLSVFYFVIDPECADIPDKNLVGYFITHAFEVGRAIGEILPGYLDEFDQSLWAVSKGS